MARAARSRRAAPRRATGRLLALAACALFGLGSCDVVQGFEHAGDALFPSVKTYLDAPGYKLVSGGYRQLVLLTSTELYILARSATDGDDSLYSLRYALPKPCAIPHVGRYWAGGSVAAGEAAIAFFHDGGSRGPLSFADAECHVSPLVLPDAELPYARITPRGPDGQPQTDQLRLLIRSAGQLLLVDPASGKDPELLIEPADGVLQGVGKANVNLVLSAGRLALFDPDWNYVETFGQDVRSLAQLGDSLYLEDANGIQRVTATGRPGAGAVNVEVVAADACGLSFPSSSHRWVAFFSPCADRTLAFWDDGKSTLSYPDLSVDDPRALVLVPKPGLTTTPAPELEQVWAYFLRDIDYNAGLGTLVARSPDGDELMLGTQAALERTALDKSGDYGFALVDVDPTTRTGRYERWEPDGTLTPLAENVLRDSPGQSWADIMMDWNGVTGTLAQVNGGAVYPVLEGVPAHGFAYQDVHHRQALFSDFDGENGTLSIGELECAPGTSHCERQVYVPHEVARGVHHPDHAFLDATEDFLPGIGFLDQFDEQRGIGRFQYRNLELGFTSIVSEGVSDFIYAGNGVLYSVPYGEGAGIWLARAK